MSLREDIEKYGNLDSYAGNTGGGYTGNPLTNLSLRAALDLFKTYRDIPKKKISNSITSALGPSMAEIYSDAGKAAWGAAKAPQEIASNLAYQGIKNLKGESVTDNVTKSFSDASNILPGNFTPKDVVKGLGKLLGATVTDKQAQTLIDKTGLDKSLGPIVNLAINSGQINVPNLTPSGVTPSAPIVNIPVGINEGNDAITGGKVNLDFLQNSILNYGVGAANAIYGDKLRAKTPTQTGIPSVSRQTLADYIKPVTALGAEIATDPTMLVAGGGELGLKGIRAASKLAPEQGLGSLLKMMGDKSFTSVGASGIGKQVFEGFGDFVPKLIGSIIGDEEKAINYFRTPSKIMTPKVFEEVTKARRDIGNFGEYVKARVEPWQNIESPEIRKLVGETLISDAPAKTTRKIGKATEYGNIYTTESKYDTLKKAISNIQKTNPAALAQFKNPVEDILKIAKDLRKTATRAGQEAVNAGLLSKETFSANKDKYAKTFYEFFENPKYLKHLEEEQISTGLIQRLKGMNSPGEFSVKEELFEHKGKGFLPKIEDVVKDNNLKGLLKDKVNIKNIDDILNMDIRRTAIELAKTEKELPATNFAIDRKKLMEGMRILIKENGKNKLTEIFKLPVEEIAQKLRTSTEPKMKFGEGHFFSKDPISERPILEIPKNDFTKKNIIDQGKPIIYGKKDKYDAIAKNIKEFSKQKIIKQINNNVSEFEKKIAQIQINAKNKMYEGNKAYANFQKNAGKLGPESIGYSVGVGSQRTYTTSRFGRMYDQISKIPGYSMDELPQAVKEAMPYQKVVKIGSVDAKTAIVDGKSYVQLPESNRYGALANKWIPRADGEYLIGFNKKMGPVEKILSNAMGIWKTGKVPFSTAAQGRNFLFSNPIQMMFSGVDPIDAFKLSSKRLAMKANGESDMITRVVNRYGGGGSTFSDAETMKLGSSFSGMNKPSEIKTAAKKVLNVPGSIYGSLENVQKEAMVEWLMNRGVSGKEAYKKATEALFDYSDKPRFVKDLIKSTVFPFATYSSKALPYVSKTMLQAPSRALPIIAFKDSWNDRQTQKLGLTGKDIANLQDRYGDWFLITGGTKENPNIIDLSYTVPGLPDLIERQTGQGMLKGAAPQALQPSSPLQAFLEIAPGVNKKFYFGSKVFNETDPKLIGDLVSTYSMLKESGLNSGEALKKAIASTKGGKQIGHILKTLLPATPLIPGTYQSEQLMSALEGKPITSSGDIQSVPGFASSMIGLKQTPVNMRSLNNRKTSDLKKNVKELTSGIISSNIDARLNPKEKEINVKIKREQLKKLINDFNSYNKGK
jgi:hypothetical protein